MDFKQKNKIGLDLSKLTGKIKGKNFSVISVNTVRKIGVIAGGIFLLIFCILYFEIYIPFNPDSHETVTLVVQKGWGDEEIADELQKLGLIRSHNFFELYVIMALKHNSLQAGKYSFSAKMYIYEIVGKMVRGDVLKDKFVILEGWEEDDIGSYLESRNICEKDIFISLVKSDYSDKFDFLIDKPKDVDLEGYLFPDTYEISGGESCEDVINYVLSNFRKKLTPELRLEIANQKKSIFDIVTMASLLEKEVRTLDDKKIASGILWKRLGVGMPLQLDATVNYITGKSDASVLFKDAKIDSPYNTYKYKGLPKGPISNPGIDSIMAAIYPIQTKYWFYLSDGITHFSETLQQHNAAKRRYLGS